MSSMELDTSLGYGRPCLKKKIIYLPVIRKNEQASQNTSEHARTFQKAPECAGAPSSFMNFESTH